MSSSAKILILRGPDEGKVYRLEEDLVNLGRGADNEISLSDESLQELQASICRRNGRFAIYTPVEDGVQVDGNAIPPEKWVWLPEAAQLHLGAGTVLQFRSAATKHEGDETDSPPASRPEDTPTPGSSVTRKLLAKRKSKSAAGRTPQSPKKPTRKVARFITDTGGDRLVRLGEDGKLPELALADAAGPKKAHRQSGEKKSPLLYVAVAVSLLLSLGMLLIDTEPSGSTAGQRAEARRKIKRFYGSGAGLKPYQRSLRDAELARAAGDARAERAAYQRVLDELDAEDVSNSINGLTGDKRDDEELRRLIGIILDRKR